MSIELPPGTAAYSNSNPPPQNRQVLTLTLMFLGSLGLAIGAAIWLAGALVWAIPPSVERQMGRAIVPIYEAQSQPSATQDELNRLLERIEVNLPAEQRENRDYQVLYIPDDTVNAAAIPGDRILIYQGLLDEVQSENELAMVLGHELGHFANRDHLRGLSRSVMVRLVLATFLGDAGSVGAIATNSVSVLTNAQFSQKQEQQADEIGLTLLEDTYGHVAGATDFFERLSKEENANLAFLASHPPSKRRVQAIEREIAEEGYAKRDKAPLPSVLTSAVSEK